MNDINDILKKTNIDDKLNKVIQIANCDAKCENKKKISILEKKYYDIKDRYNQYETDLNNAERDYYIAKGGTTYYNKHIKHKYSNEIKNEIEQKYEKLFNTKIMSIINKFNNAEHLIEYLKDYDNITNILKTAKRRNYELNGSIQDKYKVNERKTEYDNEHAILLNKWIIIFKRIYYVFIGIIMLTLIYKSYKLYKPNNNATPILGWKWDWWKISYFILLILTPYIMPIFIYDYISVIVFVILNIIYLTMFKKIAFKNTPKKHWELIYDTKEIP